MEKGNFIPRGQAAQDLFAAEVLGWRNSTFVDLGAGDPVQYSNTYELERRLGWCGILADIATEAALREKRSTDNEVFGNALSQDVMTSIVELAKSDGEIGFLSLDLEPPEMTLSCLLAIPFESVRFHVICCEHDLYRRSPSIKAAMQGILQWYGYVRVADNVRMLAKTSNGLELVPVEDWWIQPDLVDPVLASQIAADIRQAVESDLLNLIEKQNRTAMV